MRINRNVFTAVLCVLAGLILIAGIYFTWLITPPAMASTPEDALATLNSPRFEWLPRERQSDYIQHAGRLLSDLSDEDRRAMFRKMRTDESMRQAMRTVRRDSMIQRYRELANASQAERNAELDRMIAQMKQFAAQRGSGEGRPRPQRQRESGDEHRGDRRGRMQQFVQNRVQQGNPQGGAMRLEMGQAIRQRAEQTGQSLPGRGPRGGGR